VEDLAVNTFVGTDLLEKSRGVIGSDPPNLSQYDTGLIRLQALRADIQPSKQSSPRSSARFDMTFQHGESPRLWVDTNAFVVFELDLGLYRLMSEQGGQSHTLFVADTRCQMVAYVNKFRTRQQALLENQLTHLFQLKAESERRPRWPALLTAWFFGSLCGAVVLLTIR
jgi:hypothetical protein